MKNKISIDDIGKLRTLIGQRLQYVAGPYLSSQLQSDFIIIATNGQFVGLQGDIHEDVFEGFPESYSSIEIVKPDENDIDKSRASGNEYSFKKGERISNLFVIRDVLEGYRDGKHVWEYSTDIGIALELESGSLTVSRLGYHDEMLQVTYLKELEVKGIPETLGRFDNDLHTNFASTRSIIRV